MRHLAPMQVAIILTLAGLVRLGAAVYWQEHWHGQFVFGDSHSYFELARTIARGEPYQLPSGEQVFRAPGYPLLLAPVFWFCDNPNAVWAARIEGCLFGSLTALVVAWWAGMLFGPRAAWIAGLIAALYPEAVAVSVPVLSEASFWLLVALDLAMWTIAWSREQGAGSREEGAGSEQGIARLIFISLVVGGIAGAATLVRPSWMLFLPFAMACGLVASLLRRRLSAGHVSNVPRARQIGNLPRKQLLLGLAMVAGFGLAMMPWWMRNYRVTGHFVPTTLQVGASLYDGWNPKATGASDMRFVPEFEAELRQSDKDHAIPSPVDGFEYRLDRRFRQAAWEWASSHPGRALQLAGVKLLRIWNVWPNEPSFSAWPVRLAVLVTYAPLMLLAAIGAWRARNLGWQAALCWLPAVYFTLLHTVFVSSMRYRQPALLGLIVLAAGSLAEFTADRNPITEKPLG
jgi:hypothetical protein